MPLTSPRASQPQAFDALPTTSPAGWFDVQQRINDLLQGKSNNTGRATIASGQTAATITDTRISGQSTLLLMPLDAEAAAVQWHAATGDGTATITALAATGADAEFRYVVIG